LSASCVLELDVCYPLVPDRGYRSKRRALAHEAEWPRPRTPSPVEPAHPPVDLSRRAVGATPNSPDHYPVGYCEATWCHFLGATSPVPETATDQQVTGAKPRPRPDEAEAG
jgi:hypothetical protein